MTKSSIIKDGARTIEAGLESYCGQKEAISYAVEKLLHSDILISSKEKETLISVIIFLRSLNPGVKYLFLFLLMTGSVLSISCLNLNPKYQNSLVLYKFAIIRAAAGWALMFSSFALMVCWSKFESRINSLILLSKL